MSPDAKREVLTRRLSSGVEELDAILGGSGFVVRGESFPSILIAGEPGCGKSTLALQIAGAAMRRERSALVIDLEESPKDAEFRADQFQLIPNHVARIYDSEPNERPSGLTGLEPGKPAICFSYYPDLARKALEGTDNEASVSGLIDFIEGRIDFYRQLQKQFQTQPLEAVVVDSLPIVPSNRGEYAAERGLFKALCALGTSHQLMMILVAERNTGLDWREFVADIVVELTWGRDEVTGDARFLRLLKTRYQESWDGRHIYRIEPERGVCLSPRAPELIRAAGRAHRGIGDSSLHPDVPKIVAFCADARFNEFLGKFSAESARVPSGGASQPAQSGKARCGRAQCEIREPAHLEKILAGSSTLLYGEDETRKNVVATRFLQAAADEVPGGGMMFIACGTSIATAADILERYWLRGNGDQGDPGQVHLEGGPGVFEHIDHFIWRIYRRLQPPARIARVLVDDEAALFRNGYFAHPLRELLRALGITSLFVRTVDSGDDDADREHFDNVIRSRHLVMPTGESRIGYRVMKFRGAAVTKSRSFELKLPATNMTLEMADTFKFYREKSDSLLTTIPWHLRLYYPADDQEEYWKDEIEGLFASVYAGVDGPKAQPFGRLEADSVFQAIFDVPPDYPLMGTEVVNFDDYCGKELAERERLVPLSAIFDREELNKLQLQFSKSVWDTAPKSPHHDDFVGVPHHLDFGIYTVRSDVLESCEITLDDYFEKGENAGKLSWLSMCAICERIQHKIADKLGQSRVGRRLRMFDAAANRIDESFLCFVLEVLWPFIDDWNIRSHGTVFSTGKVQDVICNLYSHLKAMGALPLSESTRISAESKDERKHPELPVFQRQWFVSNWWLQRRHRNLKGKIAVIHPPILAVHGEARAASSLRGDWFLGVVRGSPDLSRAASAIKTLTSEVACRNLQRAEMGVPPLRSLLMARRMEHLDVQQFYDLYEHTVTRRDIPDYHRIRTSLTNQFRDIFSCEPIIEDNDELKLRVTRATQAIDAYLAEQVDAG